MTLVLIGPVCKDLILIGDEKISRVGGASYYQSFVYEEFYDDYIAIVNASDDDLLSEFPDESKVKLILKDDTHYFINEYPDRNNRDIRKQSTNFADIPILKEDLKIILEESDLIDNNGNIDNIDAFVLNPLNSNDFPIETIDYLSSFDVPIFISIQGFLRFKGEDGTMVLNSSEILASILDISQDVFLDENEFNIIKDMKFTASNLVITNGSKGSRIINFDGESIRINAVKCENIIDATGCGDTYMSAYICARLNSKSLKDSGDFASLISSKKLENAGPYKSMSNG